LQVNDTEVENLVLPQMQNIEGLFYAGQIVINSKNYACGRD